MFKGRDVVVVQLLSRVWLFATPWTAAHQASLSFTISNSKGWDVVKLIIFTASSRALSKTGLFFFKLPACDCEGYNTSVIWNHSLPLFVLRYQQSDPALLLPYWLHMSTSQKRHLLHYNDKGFDLMRAWGSLQPLLFSWFCLPRFSVQFSHSVVSDSLRPHGLQHARPPYPSPTPRACSNSCPSSQWCHPIISSSVIPFSSCLQSFPASGSFPRSQFFVSGS